MAFLNFNEVLFISIFLYSWPLFSARNYCLMRHEVTPPCYLLEALELFTGRSQSLWNWILFMVCRFFRVSWSFVAYTANLAWTWLGLRWLLWLVCEWTSPQHESPSSACGINHCILSTFTPFSYAVQFPV